MLVGFRQIAGTELPTGNSEEVQRWWLTSLNTLSPTRADSWALIIFRRLSAVWRSWVMRTCGGARTKARTVRCLSRGRALRDAHGANHHAVENAVGRPATPGL